MENHGDLSLATAGLQETLKLCFDRIMSTGDSAEPRLFFPNGIESIHIASSFGIDAKGFSFDISIAGPNASSKQLTEEDLPGRALLAGQSVTDACKAEFPAHQFACNDFVITVAADFGITLTGVADDIVAAIQAAPWNSLGNDANAAAQAATFAGQDGHLVIAGSTAAELNDTNGHVVIITPGALVNRLYPHLYCGSTNPAIRLQDSSINFAFAAGYRDRVHYGWIPFT